MSRRCRTITRAFLILACVFFSLSSFALAKSYTDSFVSITADELTYNKFRGLYEATGDVTIIGENIKVTTSYARYYPATKSVVVDELFVAEVDAYKISGSRLEYNFASDSGNAMIVRINFGQTYLGGSFMKIDSDRYNILNAYFTGCNKPDSDYHASSNEINFYPKTGLLVGYWGTMWVGSIPTIPIPTFVYGAPVPKLKTEKKADTGPKKRYIKREHDIFPTPGLGSNSEDGTFGIIPFDSYPNPTSYIRTHISYSDKQKFGVATAANYILFNDHNEGEIRLGTNAGESGYGGWTHIMSFGKDLLSDEERKKYVYNDYFPGNKYMYEIETNVSYRERINIYRNEGPFGRVSFIPKVSVRANRNFFLNDDFTYFSEVNWAAVSEESTGVSGQREEFKTDITFDHDLWFLGRLSAKSQIDLIGYMGLPLDQQNSYWDSSTQDISLSQKWGTALETSIGNTHIYFNNGSTPYEFEQYWFSPSDTINTHAKLYFWTHSLAYDGMHLTPSGDWKRQRYSLVLGMHCYNIVTSYELVRDQTGKETHNFLMTVELTPSKW